MPTYIFRNKTTGAEWEKDMRMSELDAYKEENNAEIMIKSVNLVGGTGENIDAKTDDGWKETLAKISEAHPSSELNKQYGKTSITDIKVNQVREKHKTLAKRRRAKQNPIK
jgi:hypothetical protein